MGGTFRFNIVLLNKFFVRKNGRIDIFLKFSKKIPLTSVLTEDHFVSRLGDPGSTSTLWWTNWLREYLLLFFGPRTPYFGHTTPVIVTIIICHTTGLSQLLALE